MRRLAFIVLLFAWTASAANLVPNSSFELGTARGWFEYGTSDSAFLGNKDALSGLITNDAKHGAKSMMLMTGADMYSRAIWLTAGTYILSAYMKTTSGTQGPYYMGVINSSDLGLITPPSIGNLTASWSRPTNGFTATSNGLYWVQFANGQPLALIDGVQLEPGTTTNAYAPSATVECGLGTVGTNGLYFAGDAPAFQLNFWNEGAAVSSSVKYQIFDVWNSNVISRQIIVSLAAATNTSTTLSLPDRKGWLRLVSRLIEFNDSYDERTLIVYPFASNIVTHATNDWLGGHPNGSDWHTRKELLANRHFARLLGPNYANTRWDYIEPIRGVFTFESIFSRDAWITNQAAAGMNVVGTLSSSDPNPISEWRPTWAVTTNGSADLMAFSNYCYVVVNRFKAYIHYWEVGPNEPFQSGSVGVGPVPDSGNPYAGSTNLPINVRVSTNYAKLLSHGVAGAYNADSNAFLIGIAGASGAGEWGLEVWTNLTADIQGKIDIISTHMYASDQSEDPNNGHYAGVTFSNPYGWMSRFAGIRPVWNTESGTYNFAGSTLKGLNGLFPIAYDTQRILNPGDEALRNASLNRQLTSTQQILSQCLRCIGSGFDRYFYYDNRMFADDSFFSGATPYGADAFQMDRAEIASLSVATHFIRHGLGPRTNATTAISILVEMYAGTNASGQAVMTGWAADRTNRTFTTANPFFAVFDAMGNLVQTNVATVRITRIPQYFVSGDMTLAELTNNFMFAAVTNAADVLPPQVSFDVAPSGLWDGSTNATLVKWTGIDDMWTPWATNGLNAPSATNVVFKVKVDGNPYSENSQSNHVWLHHLSAGNHKIYVTATDKVGNSAEYLYEFMPPPVVINVSGVANIGTITIQP